MRNLAASLAYQHSNRHRGLREQEADVFLRVNAGLRNALEGTAAVRARALADNDRLWIAVMDLLRDPANAIQPSLRASVISVGLTVQRESAGEDPDLNFLIGINEQIAAGLSGL